MIKRVIRRALRRAGLDLVRYPLLESLPRHLGHMFDLLGVDCVLDVGAMDGRYAEMLRGIGYRGPIVSFEPVARNLELLGRKIAGDPLWTVVPLALGSADEERTIHVLSGIDFSSFLPINPYGRQTFPGATDTTSEEVVTIRRLDGLMPELTSVPDDSSIFLKLDTQGYDLEVLAGAAGCLDRVVGLQIEMSLKPIYIGMPGMTEALSALRELGFDPTGLFKITRDADGALVDVDCVARRRG